MRPHCFARCRPISPARVLGCTGIAEGVAFSSPAFMRGMYFSTNLILVNAVNHLFISRGDLVTVQSFQTF